LKSPLNLDHLFKGVPVTVPIFESSLPVQDAGLGAAWPDLKEELLAGAERVCALLGLAKHHLIIEELRQLQQQQQDSNRDHSAKDLSSSAEPLNFPVVRARIELDLKLTPLGSLRSSQFGRLVAVKGTIVRISTMRPVNTWLAFQCLVCLRYDIPSFSACTGM
jgi:DNA helicase MCM8